jgi:hypothetical protein
MSAPARRKKEKNVENNGEKPIFIFTGRILLLFCPAGSVCKVDITLYISPFKKAAWLFAIGSHIIPARSEKRARNIVVLYSSNYFNYLAFLL